MTHPGNQDRAAHVRRVLPHAHAKADLAILAGVFQREGRIGRDCGGDGRNLGVPAENGKEKALLLLSHVAVAVYAERGADLVCGLAKLKLPKTKVCVFQGCLLEWRRAGGAGYAASPVRGAGVG